jgi:hypothetical protein
VTGYHLSKTVLAFADNGHILNALAQFGGRPASQWLPAHRSVRSGALPRTWRLVRALPQSDVVSVLAAAFPNHCVDGWSYMARAMSAFLAGDLHSARHLAYYSQLRAALSILGNLGVGVFNGINFVIDPGGNILQLDVPAHDKGLGTHHAVWAALYRWVVNPVTARRFLSQVRVANSPLALCLDAIWPGAAANAVAMPLIAAWGLDLQRGMSEHHARNRSSYNPQAFEAMADIPMARLDFVENVWAMFEPTSSSRFDLLDRYVLRSVLWHQHDTVTPDTPRKEGAIIRNYSNLPNLVQGIASRDFLVGIREPGEPSLLAIARSTRSPALADEMIARGLLLLRAATAFTISSFNDAGIQIGSGNLRPWIDPLAVARGFWPPSAPPADPVDLWEDVKIALRDFMGSMMPPPGSLNEWMRRSPVGLPVVTETERIAVWSLGS